MFEITKRDGLARIGKLETAHGILETPALLPVINPRLITISPRELYDVFGVRGLITNSYIIRNDPVLREKLSLPVEAAQAGLGLRVSAHRGLPAEIDSLPRGREAPRTRAAP